MLNFIKKQDLYGDPISITYKGMSSHPSYLGGLMSMLQTLFILGYGSWRYYLFSSH